MGTHSQLNNRVCHDCTKYHFSFNIFNVIPPKNLWWIYKYAMTYAWYNTLYTFIRDFNELPQSINSSGTVGKDRVINFKHVNR